MSGISQDTGRPAAGDDPAAAIDGRFAALAETHVVMNGVRLLPSAAFIDHLLIGPTGVWVIDDVPAPGTYSAGDGTLWREGESIRRNQEIIEWKAALVTSVTGFEPAAVLAFTRATLPRPAQMIGRTRCLQLDVLADYLADAEVVLGEYDIGRIAALLRASLASAPTGEPEPELQPQAEPEPVAELEPEPAASPFVIPAPPPVVIAPSTEPAPRPEHDAGPPTDTSEPASRLLLAGAVLAALSGIALLVASIAVATSTETVDPRGATTTATAAETPTVRRVPVTFECLAPYGWAARLGWPGDAGGVVGYDVTAEANGLTLTERRWNGPGDLGDPIVGLQPGITLTVTAESRPAAGGEPATAVTTAVVPTDPC